MANKVSKKENNNLMEKIVGLSKRRGFIYPSSDIYGGVEALWDYGPLGALLKNNIKTEWLKRFVQEREDVVLIDGSVLMAPQVWQASGHLERFTDPLVECLKCHKRFRADYLSDGRFIGEGKAEKKNQCSWCGGESFSSVKQFNLMFKTFLGPADVVRQTYLRPETAQSMFVDFKLVQESMRLKIPFGIAQIGRSFRNEITTGNFTFRSREFDIAEIEYFIQPQRDEEMFNFWLDEWERFFVDLGLKKENLRRFEHPKSGLAHYSKRTVDIEYRFPFGWAELAGVANRTDFDLSQHAKFSGKDLSYFDKQSGKNYFPFVIEPTVGIDRLLLALLVDAYKEVKGGRSKTTAATKSVEVVLKLNKKVAPIKAAVLPLLKNKTELVKKATAICQLLKPHFFCQYDEVDSIGRRYRRQDEIGTVVSVTVDFETLKDETVTVRDRDTMAQIRVAISRLTAVIQKILNGVEFLKLGEPV